MTHYCYACKQKIERNIPHFISRYLSPRMFYPRFHVECANTLEQYDREMSAYYTQPNFVGGTVRR